jgi:tRNA (guanine-N7-)-methyltransferase
MQHHCTQHFARRDGRLTVGQARALQSLWPLFGIDWQPGTPLLVETLFPVCQPVVVDVGFGDGQALLELAARDPGRNYLGLEVYRPGIGHVLLELEQRALTNVKLMYQDALLLFDVGIPESSVDSVLLWFPDPWPKQRHHKRRLVQLPFVTALARILKPGGVFHAATDWEPYAQHMLRVFETCSELFVNCAGRGQFIPRPATRPETKFERRGQRLGHAVYDLMMQRCQ